MEYTEQSHHDNLPQVLVLGDLAFSSSLIQPHDSNKFRVLILSPSLSAHQFIATTHHHPSSIRALVCPGGYPVTADLLRLLPSLGLVVTASAGTDHIDFSECRRRGIQVAGAASLFTEDVADMGVALLIDLVMKISAADRYLRTWVQRGSSGDFLPGSKLGDKKVGIVGLGKIGLKVAQRLEAFGCTISYHSRNKNPLVSYPFYSNIVELAANNNVLIVCCALNDQTRHIINREVMLALGKDGVIVNVGRGALIDEKELLKCLMEGEVGGAGLDVFENEPHVPKELFELDNVVLSPHAGAMTSEAQMGVCQLVLGNLEAFFSNKPLATPVVVD